MAHLLTVCDGFLRFISDVTPAELLATNILVNPISYVLLQAVVGGQRDVDLITLTTLKRLVPCLHGDVKLKLNWFLGNGPDSRKDLMEVFEEAAKRGVIIINITQCARGTVSASYAPGRVSAFPFPE